MTDDWFEIILAFLDAEVRFIVVGAHSLAVHGVPRATQDLDLWVDPEPENAQRTWKALAAFGAPLDDLRITAADLRRPDHVVQIGLPPNRIDILTSLSGVETFGEAWERRAEHLVRGRSVPFLDRDALIASKRAAGRTKDLADLEQLGVRPSSRASGRSPKK